MKTYLVVMTETALADMEELYRYIACHLQSPQSAMRQYNRIAEAVLSLETMPERYPLFEMEPEHSMGLRKCVVDRYLICYLVDSDTVTVTDVLYGASDVHNRLDQRHSG